MVEIDFRRKMELPISEQRHFVESTLRKRSEVDLSESLSDTDEEKKHNEYPQTTDAPFSEVIEETQRVRHQFITRIRQFQSKRKRKKSHDSEICQSITDAA